MVHEGGDIEVFPEFSRCTHGRAVSLSRCCYCGSTCGPKIIQRTKSAVDAKRIFKC
jgi:hypothetical protein